MRLQIVCAQSVYVCGIGVCMCVHVLFRHFIVAAVLGFLCFLFSVGILLWQHISPSALRPFRIHTFLCFTNTRNIVFIHCVCVPIAIVFFSRLSRLLTFFTYLYYMFVRTITIKFCVSEHPQKRACSMIQQPLHMPTLHVSPHAKHTHTPNRSPFLFETPYTRHYTCIYSILPFLYGGKCKHTFDTEHLTMELYSKTKKNFFPCYFRVGFSWFYCQGRKNPETRTHFGPASYKRFIIFFSYVLYRMQKKYSEIHIYSHLL